MLGEHFGSEFSLVAVQHVANGYLMSTIAILALFWGGFATTPLFTIPGYVALPVHFALFPVCVALAFFVDFSVVAPGANDDLRFPCPSLEYSIHPVAFLLE